MAAFYTAIINLLLIGVVVRVWNNIVIIILFTVFFLLDYHLQYPKMLAPQKMLVQGIIASVPESRYHASHFLLIAQNAPLQNQRLWVTWYAPSQVSLRAGDVWQFELSIKPPEKNWLIAERINGVASVEYSLQNQLYMPIHNTTISLNHYRAQIYQDIKTALPTHPMLGFISALAIGMRDAITEQQWQDLRATGTNHLMAIAGLHLGILSGWMFLLVNFLWRRLPRALLFLPAQDAAAMSALFAAITYSALAGFALPTQRAVIMLSVFMLAQLLRRHLAPATGFKVALVVILLWEPLAILTPSLWLSFGAVGLLIYTHSARLGQAPRWQHWLMPQWVLAVGLIPFGAYFFQQTSFTAIVANMLAIPVVGFIILPLVLLGVLADMLYAPLAATLWQFAAAILNHFWRIMHWLASLPYGQYEWMRSVNIFLILAGIIGVLIILAPRGFPERKLGLFWLLPLFFWREGQ